MHAFARSLLHKYMDVVSIDDIILSLTRGSGSLTDASCNIIRLLSLAGVGHYIITWA